MQESGKLGVMLDCSRNAVASMFGVKKFIDVISKMGYNRLMLYTEDTYEIEGEPLFGYMRGRYAKTDLKEIDAYAAKKGVELVPCIQTLAHLNQIFGWGPYNRICDMQDVLLVGEERTYELIGRMLDTCSECFTSRKIHIGMDEAFHLGLGKYREKHGWRDRSEIFLEHLNKVAKMADERGLKPMIWSDMFFHLAFNGKYYVKEGEIPPEVRAKVPKNVELVYWDYYSDDKEMYESMLDKHLQFDNPVSFAGGVWKWGRFAPWNGTSIRRTELAVRACNEKGVKDILITAWGDDGNECPIYAVLPSLLYAAECAKGNYDIENAKQKFNELFGEDFDDFCSLDLRMPDTINKLAPEVNGAKAMFYNDPFAGRYDSTVLGTGEEGKLFGEHADRLAKAKQKSKNFGYIFEHYEKLCRFLEVKYDLGFRARAAYQAGDRAALTAIVEDFKEAEKRLKDFHAAFEKMWMTDYKPFGFDVHELRIGGLKMRLEGCRSRLERYLSGEISVLDELEVELVDYYGGETLRKTMPACYGAKHAATVNRI